MSSLRFRRVAPWALIAASLWAGVALAQPPEATADPPAAGVVITVRADDGLALHGDWLLMEESAPTVLLIHQMYTTSRSWAHVRQALAGAGFNVLAIDLRGYGRTGGGIDWRAATDDIMHWLSWLRSESGITRDDIAIVGSSIGANLALVGCGADPACRAVIAISPGWSYYGVAIGEALAELAARPALVIYAETDRWPALAMPQITAAAGPGLEILALAGNRHGMDLVAAPMHVTGSAADDEEATVPVLDTLTNWLIARMPR
jgi:pimeloyl-ACP methyl ester carboxylesterase